MAANSYDIVGVGSAVFDTLMITEAYPGEDSKMVAREMISQGGGPASTALVAAAVLGASAYWFGSLGDDLYGHYVLDEMRQFGVQANPPFVPGAQTALATVLLNAQNSSRTIVYTEGTVPQTGPAQVQPEILKGAKVLHVDNHQMAGAVYAAKLAREFGVPVSFDAGTPHPGTEELLPLCDILVPSEVFVKQYTGCDNEEEAALRLYEKFKPRVFAVTLGSRGGLVHTGQGLVPYPAYPVKAISTNGAGDIFHGAFLVGLLRGMAPLDAARFASYVAGITCTTLGTRHAIPTFDESIAWLRKNDGDFAWQAES